MDINQTLNVSNVEFPKVPFVDPCFSCCISIIYIYFLNISFQSFFADDKNILQFAIGYNLNDIVSEIN